MNTNELRKRAEAIVGDRRRAQRVPRHLRTDWLQRELDVHIQELEIQNEELRRAQLEIEQARDRYAALFERAPIAYVTVTRDGTISEANAAALALLRSDGSARVDNAPLASFMASEAAADVERFRRTLFAPDRESPAEEPVEATVALRRAGGAPRAARLVALPSSANAPFAQVALVEVPLAADPPPEEHKLEALGAVASGIAHDFNNVLMAVRGCVDMMGITLDGSHPARAHLDALSGCVASGTSITRRLLDYCRRDAGPAVVFDVNDVLAAHLEFLHTVTGDAIELRAELEAPGARVKAPSSDVVQAVLNLVVNARDAMLTGGRIVIRTRLVELSEAESPTLVPGTFVAVSVSDTGPGIPDGMRDSLFDPFTTTKPRGSGTGIGLTIVKSVVERAGGVVRVASQPGVGSTFELLFPKSHEALTTEAAPAPPIVTKGSETVLVVEDDRLVRTAARYYLEQAGYRVLEAATKAEAVQCCARFPGRIDLLVTDIALPGGADGLSVARAVRELRGGVRVVLMSGHDVGQAAHGSTPGDAALLQKPFASEALLTTVRRSLDAPAPAGLLPPPARREQVEGRRRVLVVEDDDSARWLLGGYFDRLGWDVIAAGDGPEALAALRDREGAVDVALVDFHLPSMRGDELARRMRAIAWDLPVVYLSGRSDLDAIDPAGVVLTKPVELPRLVKELERAAAAALR